LRLTHQQMCVEVKCKRLLLDQLRNDISAYAACKVEIEQDVITSRNALEAVRFARDKSASFEKVTNVSVFDIRIVMNILSDFTL
jgi:hypothetical protein